MTEIVRMRARVVEVMARHATETWPEECCGLLLGRGNQVEDAVRARNAAEDRTRRFLVDPADHFEAIRQARSLGVGVVGAYHSHPRSEPVPSPTDSREALADPQFIHVIIGPPSDVLSSTTPALAAYRFVDGRFSRVAIDVEPSRT